MNPDPTRGLFDDLENPITIMFVCGPIASGKTVYAETLQKNIKDSRLISVSQAARDLLGVHTRAELQSDPAADEELAEYLEDLIAADNEHTTFILDGPRQLGLIELFIAAYGMLNVRIIWIDPGKEVRKARYTSRNRSTDAGQSFEAACQGDIDLGLNEIEFIAQNFLSTAQ